MHITRNLIFNKIFQKLPLGNLEFRYFFILQNQIELEKKIIASDVTQT